MITPKLCGFGPKIILVQNWDFYLMILQFSSVLRYVTEKLGQFVQKNQATPELMGTSREKKNLRRKIPFVWTRKERRPTELKQEYNVDWRLVRIFRQFLHQFFSSHFCGHATKSHFSVTIRQHSIQTSSISHYSWNSIFSLNIRGQVGTYIFASVFVPLIQILTKKRRNNTKI